MFERIKPVVYCNSNPNTRDMHGSLCEDYWSLVYTWRFVNQESHPEDGNCISDMRIVREGYGEYRKTAPSNER